MSSPQEDQIDCSEALFARAVELMPGGVNSPVRAFRGVGGTPRFIKSAQGATMTDVDGRTYIDYVGSCVATLGLPDSPGVPAALARNTIIVAFNDAGALAAVFQEHSDVAAVIIEPVVGNMGCVPPRAGFLQAVRELTSKHGALLIF